MPIQTIETRGATAAAALLRGPLSGAPPETGRVVRFVTPFALGGDPAEPDEEDEIEDIDDEEDDEDEDDDDEDEDDDEEEEEDEDEDEDVEAEEEK